MQPGRNFKLIDGFARYQLTERGAGFGSRLGACQNGVLQLEQMGLSWCEVQKKAVAYVVKCVVFEYASAASCCAQTLTALSARGG